MSHLSVGPDTKNNLVKAFEDLLEKESTPYDVLHEWYIESVMNPVFTEKQLRELCDDFWLVPKQIKEKME